MQTGKRSFAVLFLLCTILFIPSAHSAEFRKTGSTLTSKTARFHFLTPSLVRMEYAPSGKFTDAPTAVVVNRKWKSTPVTIDEAEGRFVAKTSVMTLHYTTGSGKFTKENLRVTWSDAGGSHAWAPGDSDVNNLGGISSSLDGARKGKLPKIYPGILSRSGYFLLDDSPSPVWDKKSSWITPPTDTGGQDMYCFVYGSDYRLALQEYAQLCGPIPMIPRYTLGAWITELNYEYLPGTHMVDDYHYTDADVKKLAMRFREEHIPLDVLVLDFGWHNFGWKGGYDWSPIFPKPKEFLGWAHKNGLKVTLNDHPGYGGEGVLSDSDSRAAAIRARLKMPQPAPQKFTLDITKDWKFSVDSTATGVQGKWFAPAFDDAGWKTLQGAQLWEDQGYPDYDGLGWYRKWVELPKDLPHPLYLIFGGVDDMYDLYINGQKIAHYGTAPDQSVYNTSTWTDVSNAIKPGERNLIAIDVNDWGGGGGLVKGPLMFSDQTPVSGIRFNLAEKRQAEAYMDILHRPLIDEGVDFWWIDGGKGSCDMPGLNSQMWTNKVFYDMTQKETGKRGFVFSRYGGWGSHRYPALFTGDTYSQWPVLGFEVQYTAQAGNVLMPYVTHDIGGFLGDTISFDLYARWMEFGALSPFLRMHSAFENPRDGNVRMPWVYGQKGIDLARKYFGLRYALLPYLYTSSRIAHDSTLALARPLYLEYPALEKAYAYPGEYFLGSEMLAAPVTDSLGGQEIYLPPGEWIDYFTGKAYAGDRTYREQYAIDAAPLFVRAGAVIPAAPFREYSGQRPLDTLIVDVYGQGSRSFNLYEDDGASMAEQKGQYAWTLFNHSSLSGGGSQLTMGPAKGKFKGQAEQRAYTLRLHAASQPQEVMVNGKSLGKNAWSWDADRSITTIPIEKGSVRKIVRVSVK